MPNTPQNNKLLKAKVDQEKFQQTSQKVNNHNLPSTPIQQKLSHLQFTLQSLLKEYSLQSIDQMIHIILDPQLSQLFKTKFPQFDHDQIVGNQIHFQSSHHNDQDFQKKNNGQSKNSIHSTSSTSSSSISSQHTIRNLLSWNTNKIQQNLKKMAIQHTYQQILMYYQKFPFYLEQCKKVLRYKYKQDDILRTHQNRKSIWLLCSGALFKIKQNQKYYQQIGQYQQNGYPEFFAHTIQKDVVRTIQDDQSKSKKQCQQVLGTILKRFAIKNPYIGYCQGMNFICNFLLLMQFQQEQTFWLMIQLLQEHLPKSYYTNMMGVAIDIQILEFYIKMHYPLLYNKLCEMNLSLSLFTLEWLVCLFTSTLPFYMLVIVWDMMFIYGQNILLKVCLVILDQLQQTIVNAEDLSELLVVIESKKKGIFIQQDQFINRISKIYIDEQLLSLCRQFIQLKLMKQKVQLNQKVKSFNAKKTPQQIDCNIQWPICFKCLKQHKSDMGQIQIWTFKEQGSPKLIENYLIQKNKKSFRLEQDSRINYKKLIIGHIAHNCNVTQYKKKYDSKRQNIELQDYAQVQNRKNIIQQLQSLMSDQNKKQTLGENRHIDFFSRAMSKNLSFLRYSDGRRLSVSMKLQNLAVSEKQKQKVKQKQKRSETYFIAEEKKIYSKLERLGSEKDKQKDKLFVIHQKQTFKPSTIQRQRQKYKQGLRQKQKQAYKQKQRQKQQKQKLSHIQPKQQTKIFSQQEKKTRNPFKKLKMKWRQRKNSHNANNNNQHQDQ